MRGVVRGLHYQLKPLEQGKLVYIISGKVYDVAVDIRRGFPWFGKYVGVVLEPAMLYGYRRASLTDFRRWKTRISYTWSPRSTRLNTRDA